MPVPPPPPPPPPPPSLSTNSQPLTTQKASGARAMLLSEIHKGTRLKKAVTNDRSAPAVEGKVVGEETNSKPFAGRTGAAPLVLAQKAAPKSGGAMNLGDLFRDGVPRKPSDLKNQKAAAVQNIAPNTLGRNDGHHKPKESPVKKAPAVAVASDNVKVVENNHSVAAPSPTVATANKSTKAAAIANLQKSIPTTAPPAAPPPLPAKLPKQKSAVAQQPSKLPLSQHNQFQTLRPTKTQPNSDVNRTPLRRTGSTEEIQKRPSAPPPPPIMRRPDGPPPPPPPLARPMQMAPAVKKVEQPMNNGNYSAPRRVDASPPLPPPRISSYLESMEQRFHFVPLSELPPPPKFVGFRKDYTYLPLSK